MTSYKITGIKYVPVKVKASDFADFSSKYTVTKNGETLQGGYGEENLKSYTAVAAVDKDTNGLKEVTKKGDSFSFGARKTGSGSGIKGEELKTANEGIHAVAKEYSGNFGEMLRVDLDNTEDKTKYYGDLGGHMQTVVWKYYGTDESNTTPLATYGTKFAADDWMHKSMGIQLGLTDSLRFKLPEGKDGTGKWTITVYALGYSDTTYEVKVAAENLPKAVEPMTAEQKTQLESLRDQAKTLLDTAKDLNNLTSAEITLKEHYDEIVALLADKDATKAAADGLIQEVPGYITAVENERATKPTVETKTATLPMITDKAIAGSSQRYKGDDYNVTVTVTLTDGKITNVSATSTAEGDDVGYFSSLTDESFFNKFKNILSTDTESIDKVNTGADAISGATYSAATVKQAVKNALSND